MIFGRKKKSAPKADEPDEADLARDEDLEEDPAGAAEPVDEADAEKDDADEADDDGADADDDGADADDDGADAGDDGADAGEDEAEKWREFDLSQDWRADGPFDIEEVDLADDEVTRLDLGALVITPIPGAEVRLQMAEPNKQIVSALMVAGQSAMELAVFAAPRTAGMWSEVREELIAQAEAAGGQVECVEGPFGTEVRRNMRVQLPDGQAGIQPSRTWVVEGPRWFLRGVLYGPIALSREHDDDLVGPFFDAFSDVVVRRGEEPRRSGDVLHLHVPEDLKNQAAAQQAAAQQRAAADRARDAQTSGPIGEGGVMGVARQGG